MDGDALIPTITGFAHVMAEGRLVFDERDLFARGIDLNANVNNGA